MAGGALGENSRHPRSGAGFASRLVRGYSKHPWHYCASLSPPSLAY